MISCADENVCELLLSEAKGVLRTPFKFFGLSWSDENLCELVLLHSFRINSLWGASPARYNFLRRGLMENWWVYIIEKKTGLYVGITTDLENRMRQHGRTVPLYYEGPISKGNALKRERQLKGWSREKKLKLIADGSENPS